MGLEPLLLSYYEVINERGCRANLTLLKVKLVTYSFY